MLIKIWQVFYHLDRKWPEIVCLKLIMISWHILLTEVTRTMLMLSTFGREYGKLCEIESAVDLRFYEANHASLAEFFKSLSYLVWSSLVVDTGSRQRVLSG